MGFRSLARESRLDRDGGGSSSLAGRCFTICLRAIAIKLIKGSPRGKRDLDPAVDPA